MSPARPPEGARSAARQGEGTPLTTVYIEGVDLWSPALPGWAAARAALRGDAATAPAPPARPATTLLAGNERRRAPETVLVALSVAEQAVAMAGRPAAELASVFTSAHGDLAIVDALCATLAADPLLLSPTRFHHSVHNAAAGYWAIATGSRRPSSAVSHASAPFAAGWLEATALCIADEAPVLLVGFDAEARGPLASVNTSRGLLGVALVMSPRHSERSRWQIDSAITASPSPAPPPLGRTAQEPTANAMVDAWPLFEALARTDSAIEAPLALRMPLDKALSLDLRVQPVPGLAGGPAAGAASAAPSHPDT